MNASIHDGRVMLRGGEQFEVEREPSYFTAVLENDNDEKRINSLIKPKKVRKIGRRLLRIEVKKKNRNAAMKKLRSKKNKIVCHHAYRSPQRTGTRYYLTDLLIVRVLPRAGEVNSLFHFHGLELYKKCAGIDNTFIVRVTDKAGKNPLKVAHDLIRQPEVVYAEPNFMERYYLPAPSDPIAWSNLWHLDQISAHQAWTITKGNREVVIAVMDDGCDLSHPAFSGDNKVVHPTDWVDGDEKPWSDYPGVTSGKHGTACAGLAIAEENAGRIVGVAPGCAFMPVRMTGLNRIALETLSVRDMFEVVGQKADVISCSWTSVPCYDPIPRPIADIIDKLAVDGGPRHNGTIICFAAGNHNAPIRDDDNTYFEYKRHPKDPNTRVVESSILNGYAAHRHTIAVAAITSANQKALYSNWGREINICAPSDNFDPLTGEWLPENELYTTDNEQHGPGYESGKIYTGFGGTSGACPIVAGVAGLVRSVKPDLSGLQVKAIIEETADMDSIQDRFINGHSLYFGYGRVNASKAVERAFSLP